jgi:hypothetical protein
MSVRSIVRERSTLIRRLPRPRWSGGNESVCDFRPPEVRPPIYAFTRPGYELGDMRPMVITSRPQRSNAGRHIEGVVLLELRGRVKAVDQRFGTCLRRQRYSQELHASAEARSAASVASSWPGVLLVDLIRHSIATGAELDSLTPTATDTAT